MLINEWSGGHIALSVILFLILCRGGLKAVRWAKGLPKAAFLILAVFPLIAIFPIPIAMIKPLDKAKQEQRKTQRRADDEGDEASG